MYFDDALNSVIKYCLGMIIYLFSFRVLEKKKIHLDNRENNFSYNVYISVNFKKKKIMQHKG